MVTKIMNMVDKRELLRKTQLEPSESQEEEEEEKEMMRLKEDDLFDASINSINSVAEMIGEAGELLDITVSHNGEEIAYDNDKESKTFDVSAYMNERMMTPLQEKLNAWTIIPNPIYCLYFILAGKWLSDNAREIAKSDLMETGLSDEADLLQWATETNSSDPFTLLNLFGVSGQCLSNSYFLDFYAFPPLPVVAIFVGILLHAPFSFHYHYACATFLPPGIARIEHWSRRMDHSMIHVASALLSYGTSGQLQYFLINVLFNADSVYRQFEKRVNPKRNKIRILISIILYTVPIVKRGDFDLFVRLWVVILISGWFFAKYPIKGWSHSAFHFIIAFVPYLLLQAACKLPISQSQIQTAARCAAISSTS